MMKIAPAVTCMVCGMKGEAKFMAHVGNDAYKCAYCLFNKSNKEK